MALFRDGPRAYVGRVERGTHRERGQASVETVALVPALVVLTLALWQAVMAGWALVSAESAARAAARAVLAGAPPRPAARHAARSATGIADDTQKNHANLLANKRAIEALGSLAWAEVLNNHPRDAVLHARAAVQRDPAQIWLKVNLLHAYLFANQIDRARETYRDNRGEQVYDDLFELAVLDEFDELRKLGLDRTAMAEFEKLRATE